MAIGNKPNTSTASTLIVFVKNAVLGAVKTRLAKSVGPENALRVYKALLEMTKAAIEHLSLHKVIYYSEQIPSRDIFPLSAFDKEIQHGADLGDRMRNAFETQFRMGAQKVIIIGSDCAEISEDHILEAERALDTCEVFFGPASDGGYYLLGMNRLVNEVFDDKPWSTPDLLLDTISHLKKAGISYTIGVTLNDVDFEEDLTAELKNLIA